MLYFLLFVVLFLAPYVVLTYFLAIRKEQKLERLSMNDLVEPDEEIYISDTPIKQRKFKDMTDADEFNKCLYRVRK